MKRKYPMRLAGRYRHKVEFQRFTMHGTDSLGQPIYTWKTLGKFRAYVNEIASNEYFSEMEVYGRINYYLELRDNKIQVDMLDRAIFKNADNNKIVLDLYKVENYEELGRFIKMYGSVLSPSQWVQTPSQYHIMPGDNFVKNPTGGGNVGTGHQTGVIHNPGGNPNPGTKKIPHVISSTIEGGNEGIIKVVFDLDMAPNLQHGHEGINIHIGTNIVSPVSISWRDKKTMDIKMPSKAYKGAVVSWSYDDSISGADLQSEAGEELINQTHAISNNSLILAPKPPHITNAEINLTDGFYNKILITLDKDIQVKTIQQADNDHCIQVFKNHDYTKKEDLAHIVITDSRHLTLTVRDTFAFGDKVELKYIGDTTEGKILSTQNIEMIKNILQHVDNSIAKPVIKQPIAHLTDWTNKMKTIFLQSDSIGFQFNDNTFINLSKAEVTPMLKNGAIKIFTSSGLDVTSDFIRGVSWDNKYFVINYNGERSSKYKNGKFEYHSELGIIKKIDGTSLPSFFVTFPNEIVSGH